MKGDIATPVASSFRDPSGYVVEREARYYRFVMESYAPDYQRLMESGLHDTLASRGLALSFEEVEPEWAKSAAPWKMLYPQQLEGISYPYEWCFDQLRDAALATLEIQGLALAHDMTLKDAPAYNIQFVKGKPVHIDTLSYERREEGTAWIAYRQFCQHFLCPLALMSYVDPRLANLAKTYLDGIPLDLAAKLLPPRARINSGLAAHIFLHARADQSRASGQSGGSGRPMSKTAAVALVDSLRRTIEKLAAPDGRTEWANYASDTNYTDGARESKESAVAELLDLIPDDTKTCWDFGGNTGNFTRLSTARGLQTTIWDIDHGAVSLAYSRLKSGESSALPLLVDLSNPSPGLGWMHEERLSMLDRGPADICLALALLHHLTIGNNVPLREAAEFFAKVGKWVVIEFVPLEDSQIQRMMIARKNIFQNYNREVFESEFSKRFEIVRRRPIEGSLREIYLLRGKS